MPPIAETITDDQPDTLTIALRKPIQVGDVTYTELTFRELTAGQFKQMSQLSGVEATIFGLAMAAGVVPSVIEKLPVSQFADAEAFVGGFFGGSRKTDGTA